MLMAVTALFLWIFAEILVPSPTVIYEIYYQLTKWSVEFRQ